MKNPSYSTTADWVWLIAGVAITALYIVFSTPIYEMLYYDGAFSNEMYNTGMYLVVACYTSLICWILPVIYYWIVDRFERWYHWLIILVLTMSLSPTVVFVYCDSYFKDNNLDLLSIPLKNFNLVNMAITFVLFCIVCLSIKKLSSHCSTTPF